MPEPKKPSKDPFTGRQRPPATPTKPWQAPGWIPRWSLRAWFFILLFTTIGGIVGLGIISEIVGSEDEQESVLASVTPVPFRDKLSRAFATYDDADATRLCLMTRLGDERSKYELICNTWLNGVEPFVFEEELRHEYMDGFATSVDQLP